MRGPISLVFLLLFLQLASASQIVHLVLVNGSFIQDAVYPGGLATPSKSNGTYTLSVGNYSTSFSVLMWVMHDPQDIYSPSGKIVRNVSSDEAITLAQAMDILMTIPDQPPNRTLIIVNGTTVLLNELLKNQTPLSDAIADNRTNSYDKRLYPDLPVMSGDCALDNDCISSGLWNRCINLSCVLENPTQVHDDNGSIEVSDTKSNPTISKMGTTDDGGDGGCCGSAFILSCTLAAASLAGAYRYW